jgi:hypothetical protein
MSLIARFATVFGLCIIPSVALAQKADDGMGEYILDRDTVSALLSWVQVNNEELNWSSRNTVAIAMAEGFVIEQRGSHLSAEKEEKCRGVAQAAQSMAMDRQMRVDKEESRGHIEMMSELDLSFPWPRGSEIDSMLERAYELHVESTQSGKAEQIVLFSSHEFENCINEPVQ